VHFRSDFPTPSDDQWRRHLMIKVDVDGGHPQAGDLLEPTKATEATFSADDLPGQNKD
jgi:L-aspartate oxidase